jgi:hypothetical protein
MPIGRLFSVLGLMVATSNAVAASAAKPVQGAIKMTASARCMLVASKQMVLSFR